MVLVAHGCKWSSCTPTLFDAESLRDVPGDQASCFSDCSKAPSKAVNRCTSLFSLILVYISMYSFSKQRVFSSDFPDYWITVQGSPIQAQWSSLLRPRRSGSESPFWLLLKLYCNHFCILQNWVHSWLQMQANTNTRLSQDDEMTCRQSIQGDSVLCCSSIFFNERPVRSRWSLAKVGF